MAADIFISYRGADRVLARKLEYRLRSRWGSHVFRDETGVTSGRPWAEEINEGLQQARVIIALVGPGWHVSSNEAEKDWVRHELVTAVDGAKPILPVLVGESEALRPKLASLPEAFRRQAVVVGPELAGFDLHKIAKALGQLGAFQGDDSATLAARRDAMVSTETYDSATSAIGRGESLLIVGTSGSGRNVLVQKLVDDQLKQGHIVASCGLERGGGLSQTHAAISGWLKSIGAIFADFNSPYSKKKAGEVLVQSVLDAGPDLLSRKVVKASTLLPLGGSQHDQLILEAVRRTTDRWAPFPPTRLVNQSRNVLEALMRNLASGKDSILGDKKLFMVVDHFDSLDSISLELVERLLDNPIKQQQAHIQFILAAYEATAWIEERRFTRIDVEKSQWSDQISGWLKSHCIDLDKSVKDLIMDDHNPYHALSKLWYLVDNGFVAEEDKPSVSEESAERSKESKKVKWKIESERLSGLEVKTLLTQDRLLDHMIEEHVPVGYRRLVEAGALIGRTFSFHAAFAASEPPSSDPSAEEPLSSRERTEWAKKAREAWKDFKTIDPEQTVFSCSESDSGELLVSFAQADLIGHLRNSLGFRDARNYHERLARYLDDPIEQLDPEDYSERYYRANLAAEHWSLAGRPRDAADAHHRAAQIAELILAYKDSRRHYLSALRLYTQLIAEKKDRTREHEDLLILSNCLYRLGQTMRLSGKIEQVKQEWGAINYLECAKDRLSDLKALLLTNDPSRWPTNKSGIRNRGIPAPNHARHHLRVYNAVSGHVHLELAQCYEAIVTQCRTRIDDELHSCKHCKDKNRHVRDRLFDALRHAEAAQGEAGSRWLLAAASARLAALLTQESLRLQSPRAAVEDLQRSNELAVEAFFHIERIIGLKPYTKDEEQEFSESVSVAWRTAGRLFRHQARHARLAEWCFRKMNDHGQNVTATVDLTTDRWLGGFLLSISKPGIMGSKGDRDSDKKSDDLSVNDREATKNIDDAQSLLEHFRNWSIESGLVDNQPPSHLRLYLMELVKTNGTSEHRKRREEHLAKAAQCSTLQHNSSKSKQRNNLECGLFMAFEAIINGSSTNSDRDRIVKLLKEAIPHWKNDGCILENGATRLASMILRRCPPLVHLVKEKIVPLVGGKKNKIDVNEWVRRAEEYLQTLRGNRILSPCIDSTIDDLAKARLAPKIYEQAVKTKDEALKLLAAHREVCEREEGVDLSILNRDVEYAAFMHDWYRDTDPARLLTLASEWHLKVSGEEWSNPRLLQGRLASTVLKQMYGAEAVLGTSRFQRITNMVDNCVVGRGDATALAKIFFLAKSTVDSCHTEMNENHSMLECQDVEKLAQAYSVAIHQRKQAPWDLVGEDPQQQSDEEKKIPNDEIAAASELALRRE